MNWPNDADGDVLRGMEESGFNFENEVIIDFNIDFDHWPLSSQEQELVLNHYPNSEIIDPTPEDIEEGIETGYVQFQVKDKLTYDLVIKVQATVTEQMKNIGGWCESWGGITRVEHNNSFVIVRCAHLGRAKLQPAPQLKRYKY